MKYFKTETRENILIAYFDNKAQSNCFGLDAAMEVQHLIEQIHSKKHSGFILTNEYHIFCSGGNLSDYAKFKDRKKGLQVNRKITSILKELSEITIPTVCLVRGDCFGGGIEWVSCFDQIYALPHILFGMWQRKIGLTWGWGGGHRLKARVSKKNLINLLMSTENFLSYRALDIGLIDAIYTDDIILEKALQWIISQKDLPQHPMKKIKRENFKKEQKIFESLWMNEEHRLVLKKYQR